MLSFSSIIKTKFSDSGREVTVQVLHTELTNFVMGIDESQSFFSEP